jgi:hypothetical protein
VRILLEMSISFHQYLGWKLFLVRGMHNEEDKVIVGMIEECILNKRDY